jgi:hypothetical protein
MRMEMTMTTKTSTRTAEAPTMALRDRIETVRGTATEIAGAFADGGKAYVGGLVELGRTLGGFGREILGEAGEHVRTTLRAKSVREATELQAAFAQHRVEMTATHAKEFVDLARVKSEEVIAPIADLLKHDKKAA